MAFRRIRVIAIAAIVAAGVAACGSSASRSTAPPASSGSKTSSPPVLAPSTGKPYWLLEAYDIAPLLSSGLSQSLLLQYFNNPQTFLIIKSGTNTKDAALLPKATVVDSFASFTAMEQAVNAGSLPSKTRYLLYDNESWSATPANEQQQPASYAGQAEQLAHQHGLGLIFTPAADLAPVLSKSYSGTSRFTGYLNLNLAGQGARVSDVLDIQAQQVEGSPTFASFVSSAVKQARTANPHALLMIGLTTKAPNETVTPQLMLSAYQQSRSEVAGYWINLPGGTSNGPQGANIAVGFLEALAPSLGYTP